ncbi:sulfatase-like hydrolase/transferase, partial [Pseudomonas aeruginosa]
MSAISRKALGLLFPLLCCVAQSQAAAPSRPNVLLIVADDLGFSDTSPFGGEISTPSLQGLADEGVRLTNFYAGPTCSVSRSMLLTGVDNHQAGLGTMAEYLQPEQKGKPGYEGQLNRRVATLAELLRDVGYNTFMSGKWHLGATPQSNAAARGFERSYTLMPGGASHMDKTQMFPGNYKARYLEDGKDVSIPDDFYSSDFYTDRLLG